MEIKAVLFATFKAIAEMNSVSLKLDQGSTIHDAVNAVLEKIPALKPHWMTQDGQLHAYVLVFLNGVDVATLPLGLLTPLHETDELDFIPPVAGG